jgi:DNA-binding response OmpR family regulator
VHAIRLLLVEDDEVSAAFLEDALAGLPARVDVARTIAEALSLARRSTQAMWLVDAHLPDGDGLDCLRALRAVAPTPALALTAGAPRAELDALCAGGYLEVLLKPVSVALLQGTVRRLLGMAAQAGDASSQFATAAGKLPAWEDAAALAAIGGNAASLAKLRGMLVQELPSMQAQLAAAQARGDAAAVAALVHKLRASCGFTGAARLRVALESLALAPLDARARRDFDFAAEDTLAASP